MMTRQRSVTSDVPSFDLGISQPSDSPPNVNLHRGQIVIVPTPKLQLKQEKKQTGGCLFFQYKGACSKLDLLLPAYKTKTCRLLLQVLQHMVENAKILLVNTLVRSANAAQIMPFILLVNTLVRSANAAQIMPFIRANAAQIMPFIHPESPLYFVFLKAPSSHWATYLNTKIVSTLRECLSPRQLELFQQTFFGKYLDMPQFTIPNQFIRSLMSKELVKGDPIRSLMSKELVKGDPRGFNMLVNGTVLQFGLREFATVTGFNCTGPAHQRRDPSRVNRLIETYFHDADCTKLRREDPKAKINIHPISKVPYHECKRQTCWPIVGTTWA